MNIGELEKNLKACNKKAAAEGHPFEDLFSAYQSEMIRQSIALSENRAEKVYIYSDLEDGAMMARPAFRIDGKFYPDYEWDKAIREGKESSSLSRNDKSDIRWTILGYAYAVRELCLEYKRAMPTVIKIVYDAKTRQVRAQYSYERLKPLNEYADEARCRMWFDEIRAKNL